jgi:hypothetical protein
MGAYPADSGAEPPTPAITSGLRRLRALSVSFLTARRGRRRSRKLALFPGATQLEGTKMTEKICPECNGEGVVDQGTEDEEHCPTCNGSGVVPDDGQGSEEVWNAHPERAMTASRIG